jgi:hypothetical protein
MTRRALAQLAAGATALGGQAPAQTPATPEQELAAAREQARANAQRIASVKLPMSTEPATRFKA